MGLKTGYTSKAGRVLVTAYEVEDQTFVVVVMGSEDHFADTAAILDYLNQRLRVTDRFLLPLVELEGGGGGGLCSTRSPRMFVKTRTIEETGPTGADAVGRDARDRSVSSTWCAA